MASRKRITVSEPAHIIEYDRISAYPEVNPEVIPGLPIGLSAREVAMALNSQYGKSSTMKITHGVLTIPKCQIAPPGQSTRISVQPSVTFRPRRFVVDPYCAPYYTIDRILIGQLIILENIPASMFTLVPEDRIKEYSTEQLDMFYEATHVDYPTVAVSQRVTIEITRNRCDIHLDCNQSVGLSEECSFRSFSGAFYGITAERKPWD